MRALVFAAGDPPGLGRADLPDHHLVIAADGGLRHVVDLQLQPDIIIGDFDSVDPDRLAAAGERATVIRKPEDKDHTDLELAMQAALEAGATEIVVLGCFGGRLDHLLANIALLSSPQWSGLLVSATGRDRSVVVVRGERALDTAVGQTVTVLATEPDTEVSLNGFAWPLHHHRIEPGMTIGVSNVASVPSPTVTTHRGVAIAVWDLER